MTEHTVNECCARTIAVRASSRRKVEPTNFMVQRVGADLERTKFARSPTNLVPQRVSADLAPADFMPQRVAADLERMKFMPHRVGADLQRIHLVRQRIGADREPTHFMGRRTHLTGPTALQATDWCNWGCAAMALTVTDRAFPCPLWCWPRLPGAAPQAGMAPRRWRWGGPPRAVMSTRDVGGGRSVRAYTGRYGLAFPRQACPDGGL